jgi:hypothetical protein
MARPADGGLPAGTLTLLLLASIWMHLLLLTFTGKPQLAAGDSQMRQDFNGLFSCYEASIKAGGRTQGLQPGETVDLTITITDNDRSCEYASFGGICPCQPEGL